jgi:hypothetical protein
MPVWQLPLPMGLEAELTNPDDASSPPPNPPDELPASSPTSLSARLGDELQASARAAKPVAASQRAPDLPIADGDILMDDVIAGHPHGWSERDAAPMTGRREPNPWRKMNA